MTRGARACSRARDVSGPGAAFGPLEWVLPETRGESLHSPAISNDCRSLYYVNDTANPREYRVDVVTR
jgi:hypothetical protein